MLSKTSSGDVKPILIQTVDGGPDQNPRYVDVIVSAIHNFLAYNLDAVFVATNAPGRSAYNRVERRMAPLSNEMAGLFIPHDVLGNHLDMAEGEERDAMECNNCEAAANILSECWNKLSIDGHPVVSNMFSLPTLYWRKAPFWFVTVHGGMSIFDRASTCCKLSKSSRPEIISFPEIMEPVWIPDVEPEVVSV